MGRFVLVCLVLAQILMIQAMAVRSDGSELNPRKLITVRTVEGSIADPPTSNGEESFSEGEEGSNVAEAPEIRRLGKHHSDKSVAGGGVIIGGLVSAIFAAVYCYIRVTRRRGISDKH